MSKRGSPYLRHALWQASFAASRFERASLIVTNIKNFLDIPDRFGRSGVSPGPPDFEAVSSAIRGTYCVKMPT